MLEKKRQRYIFLEKKTPDFGIEQWDEITREGKAAEQATKQKEEAGKSMASVQGVEDESGLRLTVKSLCVLQRSGIFSVFQSFSVATC